MPALVLLLLGLAFGGTAGAAGGVRVAAEAVRDKIRDTSESGLEDAPVAGWRAHGGLRGAGAFGEPSLRQGLDRLAWAFDNASQASAYAASPAFRSQPVGVRVDAGTNDLFLSVPRFVKGVPAVIARVVGGADGAVLHPFPSWEDNALGAEGAIQSALGFVVDCNGNMWVADNGKTADRPPAQPQIVTIDIGAARVVRRYPLPEAVAPLDSSFLNDLVVDSVNSFVFVSDSADPVHGTQGGIIVYDYGNGDSWRVLNAAPSTTPNASVRVTINGRALGPTDAGPQAGCDGIALSPDRDLLVWTPLTSHSLYALPTSLLRTKSTSAAAISAAVGVLVADKGYASDGIIFDQRGRLFVGSLDTSAVYALTLSRNGADAHGAPRVSIASSQLVMQDAITCQWPDTLAFDHRGGFVWLADGPAHFPPLLVNITNFRVWSVDVGADAYFAGWTADDDSDKWIIVGFGAAIVVAAAFAAVMTHRRKQREQRADEVALLAVGKPS